MALPQCNRPVLPQVSFLPRGTSPFLPPIHPPPPTTISSPHPATPTLTTLVYFFPHPQDFIHHEGELVMYVQ